MAGQLRAGWRDKLDRADTHFDDLKALVREYLAVPPYKPTADHDPRSGKVRQQYS